MESDTRPMVLALKFVSGETKHVCRLCFASTENLEISMDDSIRLQKTFLDETVTFADMFEGFGVTSEAFLPQVLCMECAVAVTRSFLFRKFCQHSNEKWNEVIERFNKSLDQAETAGPKTSTLYLLLDNKNNVMFTSKRHNQRCKKVVLAKIKNLIKSREKYVKVKNKRKHNIRCVDCRQNFKSNSLLAKHNTKVHNITSSHSCTYCTKMFASLMQLESHAERVHYPKKIKCLKCDKKFSTQRLLKNHDKFYHRAAICKLCFVQFPSKKDLRSHLDKHDINKCPKCNKNLLNIHTFKFHLKNCGSTEKQPNFFCDICKKGYVRKNGIKTHLKIDHGFGRLFPSSDTPYCHTVTGWEKYWSTSNSVTGWDKLIPIG